MRLSFIAFAGLIALGGNLGVRARAIPNELSSSSAIYSRDIDTLTDDNIKRGLVAEIPRPVAIRSPRPAPPPSTKKPTSPPSTKKPTPPPSIKKPAPTRGALGKAVCLPKPKKKGAVKRATYTQAEAKDTKKVYQWLLDNEKRLKEQEDIVKDRIVFFASGGGEGREMTINFINKNPEYAMYDHIFMRSKYSNDFSGVDASKGKNAEAASEALALWTRHPIVFNSDRGKYTFTRNTHLLWLTELKPLSQAFG
jgi:hypothetical protein